MVQPGEQDATSRQKQSDNDWLSIRDIDALFRKAVQAERIWAVGLAVGRITVDEVRLLTKAILPKLNAVRARSAMGKKDPVVWWQQEDDAPRIKRLYPEPLPYRSMRNKVSLQLHNKKVQEGKRTSVTSFFPIRTMSRWCDLACEQ